jgi:uncharacterized protein YcaQ
VLPILYGDQLIGRQTGTLAINGFWLEDDAMAADAAFAAALGRGLAHFATFAGAEWIGGAAIGPGVLRERVRAARGALP